MKVCNRGVSVETLSIMGSRPTCTDMVVMLVKVNIGI